MTEQYQTVNINLPGVRQVSNAELVVDESTTAVDPVFAPLISTTIQSSGGPLETIFTASVLSTALVGITFRVSLDGVPLFSRGTFGLTPTLPNTAAFDVIRAAAAGPHTISIDWAKIAGSAAGIVIAIAPVTASAFSGGSLVVKELFNG